MTKRRKHVDNVQKPQVAEGAEIFTGVMSSGYRTFVQPRIDAQLVEQYSQNAILADPVRNLKRQMFRGEAQFTVNDENGEEDPLLSKALQGLGVKLDVFNKAQWVFNDSIFGGCSVFSIGWETVDVKIDGRPVAMESPVEIRHLPWNSFWQSPVGYVNTYNPVMPGIVVDEMQNIHVFQSFDTLQKPPARTAPGMYNVVEIENFTIIKDPSTPDPAGSADCLPLIPVITAYNHANNAENQRMNRVGAPLIFPYVEKITASNKAYVEAFTQKWGKDTGFILTEGMSLLDPHITDTMSAAERMIYLKKLVDSYFNPSTPLAQTEGTSIGGTDAGATELLQTYVNNTLTWIEDGFEAIFQLLLDKNGYEGYTAIVAFPKVVSRNDQQITAELDLLARNGAILKNEMRVRAPNLNLSRIDAPEWDQPPEPATPVMNIHGVGNVGGLPPKVARPEIKRTESGLEDIIDDLAQDVIDLLPKD